MNKDLHVTDEDMVSIILPARTEKYLNKTIQDILAKATGPIEILPVMDGYGDVPQDRIKDPRVNYIEFPPPVNYERRKRHAINTAVLLSHGKYVCWIDAHCVVAPGFDEVLKRDCEENMVMVPRRYKLNVAKWDREEWPGRPPIDYEYFMWQYVKKKRRLAGYRWDAKSIERKDIMIDDIFTAQGSFFFMHRTWFDKLGLMKIEGYTGWGQEGEEVSLTSIQKGGRTVVNKNTWYAHMHKGQMHGRMYKWTDVSVSYEYSFNYWVHDNREFFKSIIEKFRPIPNWRDDWELIVYGKD